MATHNWEQQQRKQCMDQQRQSLTIELATAAATREVGISKYLVENLPSPLLNHTNGLTRMKAS